MDEQVSLMGQQLTEIHPRISQLNHSNSTQNFSWPVNMQHVQGTNVSRLQELSQYPSSGDEIPVDSTQDAASSYPHLLSRARSKGGPQTCPHCGKQCPTPSLLQIHVRVHTGEKPFKCWKCGMAFSTKSNMMRHVASKHAQ